MTKAGILTTIVTKIHMNEFRNLTFLQRHKIPTFSGKVPLKWMAPEAVHHRLYTSQSDIWSYGILLWEIMTMGESPFKDVPFEQFMENIRTGAHPEQPPYCPNKVYIVMQACWRFRPEDRPPWDKVVDFMYDLCLGKFCTRVRLRFFDKVGHQTTNASIGNKYFFTK